MTCGYCKTNSTIYNMRLICCIARHIKMQFMPAHATKSEREVRNEYAKQTIKQHGFSLEQLTAEMKRLKND